MRKYKPNLRHKFSRFMVLPFCDQLLLIETIVLLTLLRIFLAILSFDKLYSIIKHFYRISTSSYKDHFDYSNRIVWAVEKAGPYVLKDKCLAQALAVHIFLNRKRIANTLEIGFLKYNNNIYAHAWIKTDDVILIGNSDKLHLYFQITY